MTEQEIKDLVDYMKVILAWHYLLVADSQQHNFKLLKEARITLVKTIPFKAIDIAYSEARGKYFKG